LIDWTASADHIHNLIRGLHPWPHAYTFLDGRRFILLRAGWDDASVPNAAPGTISHADGDQLRVAAGTGTVRLLQIQPEGKRPLGPREFLAGHHLTVGARFGPA
jgi:methionyl-tRNA formyltransferase